MKTIHIWVLGVFACIGIFAIFNTIYPELKNFIVSSKEDSKCSSTEIQKLIDSTWPKVCNGEGSTECGIRKTGSTQISNNSCYIWAKLPTFDDSTTSILKSAIINTDTNIISHTYPTVHTCRNNPEWTTTTCN